MRILLQHLPVLLYLLSVLWTVSFGFQPPLSGNTRAIGQITRKLGTDDNFFPLPQAKSTTKEPRANGNDIPRQRSTSRSRIPRRYVKQKAKEKEWLTDVTAHLLATDAGSLTNGKWHELVSIFTAWSSLSKRDPQAPIKMEALLKRLLEERSRNEKVELTIDIYNRLLDAWACAALFSTHKASVASQRAREILVLLQETYEASLLASSDAKAVRIQPNRVSFELVFHAVTKTEGPLIARRLLAWMEYLHKSGKNSEAQPLRSDYILLLDAYANSSQEGSSNPGLLAEGFLRHMKVMGLELDTLCYNIAIKAWNKARRGRESAEHAEHIMSEMDAEPDCITYSSVITAWASSGMRAHAVSRVEELLRGMEAKDLTPNTVVLNAVMSAWVKSRNPAAVERTFELLTQMEQSDGVVRPDLISYNTHLHALAMHSGKRPEYARRAETILLRLENERRPEMQPNLFSYNSVIDAYCRSNDALRAADVLRNLIKREGVDPDTFSFNQVLSALSRSSGYRSARMAEDLLKFMDDSHRSGALPRARPDVQSYASVLFGFSRSGERDAAERAQALLDTMKARAAAGETHLKPNRYCYNSLIAAWGNSGQGTLGARKAESLLEEMKEIWLAGDESMAPNIVSYNTVMHAWARSGTRCCGVKAEYYLDQMWELYKAGDTQVKPNDFSYNTVINAISRSQNEGKAQKALRILRRMDMLYRAGNKEARPNEVTYTAVLNSCAFPAVLDPRIRRKALDTAIFTLEELQTSRYGHPNHVTYGTFLLAVANLLPEDDESRKEVIERAFKQCCKDGQVGEMVLDRLRKAASPELYEKLLSDFIRSGGQLSIEDLPEEWRCNVREKSQRKSRPQTRKKDQQLRRAAKRNNSNNRQRS